MKACICRNISDHKVKQVLADFFEGIIVITKRRGDAAHETRQSNNLDDLHEACSGGLGFNCGKCACYMAELAVEHNHNVRLNELRENLPLSGTLPPQNPEIHQSPNPEKSKKLRKEYV